ncbi:MAG: phage tail sheath subtilisin-like domain-containing protein [Nitrospirota bacterium]
MAVQVSYPGVYIEEFTPGAPIEGVGTNIAAFLGPANDGPLNEPIKITSWDQFLQRFGEKPLAGFYLWYAVRGFFTNGGKVCYVTRVSNATFSQLELTDSTTPAPANPIPTIVIRARKPGVQPQISITVEHVKAVPSTGANAGKLFRPTATIVDARDTSITVSAATDAAKFQPGDHLTWNNINEANLVEVFRAEGAVLRLKQPLSRTYAAGNIRLMDLKIGDKVFRVENAAKLASGSVITLKQGTGNTAITDTGLQVKRVDAERLSSTLTTYHVELRTSITKNFPMTSDTSIESAEFKLTVGQGGVSKDYNELSMDPEHPNYFVRVIRDDETGMIIAEPSPLPNTTKPPDNRPQAITAANARPLSAGTDDSPATLAASDYVTALAVLEAIDEINLVAIPDRTEEQTQRAVVEHCEKMKDRFALLDARRNAASFGTDSVEVQRLGLESPDGYAALYYPWLLAPVASGTGGVLVPPSGHIAGVIARTDNNRGVHKAPAGNEAVVRDALGVERIMSDDEQGQLNMKGINVVRVFSGGRPVVWGARTTSKNTNWQYVNVRRLFIFLEESIEESIRWAVFEPNNLQLWQKLRRSITEFLTRVWRDGALFGKTAEEAFYVRIDEALNPPTTQALGRLYIEIGVRPTYPAEFIVVRIGIWQGGSEIAEG